MPSLHPPFNGYSSTRPPSTASIYASWSKVGPPLGRLVRLVVRAIVAQVRQIGRLDLVSCAIKRLGYVVHNPDSLIERLRYRELVVGVLPLNRLRRTVAHEILVLLLGHHCDLAITE